MLDIVHRDTPRQASDAGLDCCSVRLYQTGKLMGGCLRLIISKHQPDIARAGAVQISPSCCFVSHTREVFRHMLVHNKGRENHVSEILTSIALELISKQLFWAFLKQAYFWKYQHAGLSHTHHLWLFENCLLISGVVKVFSKSARYNQKVPSPKCMEFF